MNTVGKLLTGLIVLLCGCAQTSGDPHSPWILIDNFEQSELSGWRIADTQNDTFPHVVDPQITEIRQDQNNHYLMKKPAAEGIVGNRKALSFKVLPVAVNVGETFTFFTRIMVEKFPNNHAFGISNLEGDEILSEGYNGFEATLRVTDKEESDGYKNQGILMVKVDSENKHRQYANVRNFQTQRDARPLQPQIWYQIWYVVNNAPATAGGQTYDVYMQGGEFSRQTLVYENAAFRVKREQPLIYFLANTNTGPSEQPYGNGGLAYDDIYMSRGVNLTHPVE